MNTTFLIADDSAAKRLFLATQLKHASFPADVIMVSTTEEAEAIIAKHADICAAFIDFEMPSQNGPAVIRSLKTKFPKAHVALTTSGVGAAQEKEARDAGAEAVVTTTNNEEDVKKEIHELLMRWMNDGTNGQ